MKDGAAVTGTVQVTVDGRAVHARPGQTIGAVLPGVLFCGIGVCFACVVVVNGIQDVRACQRVLAEGDEIRTRP
ncbi:2Fe-2S iron-sulfur cluster-binding protein [Actinocrispum wychmicini]|uniref:2Fe-2S iron-sulfur cluster protein n=1 Tax=Actinocrispum wychmicini TaxID=1213861 RepID=A0A4V6NP11_9PSEU|nr:2Fe-2S iron-sulfur cluster-binding protein [Actinocrispum wychmicini]TCO62620.1 2Fe-2S iron-sulfur cluster protein [Actinocrispum wychmicini]